MQTYEPTCGTHISNAASEAIALANKIGDSIAFSFNGIDLIAAPGGSVIQLVDEWDRLAKERAEHYRNSPEGVAAAKSRQDEIRHRQLQVDRLLAELPSVLASDQWATLRWLEAFADVADDVGVAFSMQSLADSLEAAGYVDGDFVGKRDELEGTSQQHLENRARYIIGQAISCLREGMPPHPMTKVFCERLRRGHRNRFDKSRTVTLREVEALGEGGLPDYKLKSGQQIYDAHFDDNAVPGEQRETIEMGSQREEDMRLGYERGLIDAQSSPASGEVAWTTNRPVEPGYYWIEIATLGVDLVEIKFDGRKMLRAYTGFDEWYEFPNPDEYRTRFIGPLKSLASARRIRKIRK